MNCLISKLSALRALLPALALACSTQASPSLLTDITLSGDLERVQWTNLTNSNSAWNVTTRTLASNPATSTGSGSLTVQAPAFAASAGVYSFSGNYTLTYALDPAIDAKQVVLQVVAGLNPDETPTDYLGLNGGPVLSYVTTSSSGNLSATASATLSGPTNLTTTFGPVDFYVLAWEWDLASIGDTVTGFSILSPLFIHTNTTGAQVDLSTNFVSAIPEPSTYVLLVGTFALAFTGIRRRSN